MLKAIYLPACTTNDVIPVFTYEENLFKSNVEDEPDYSIETVLNDSDWVVFIQTPNFLTYQIQHTTHPDLDVLSNVLQLGGKK